MERGGLDFIYLPYPRQRHHYAERFDHLHCSIDSKIGVTNRSHHLSSKCIFSEENLAQNDWDGPVKPSPCRFTPKLCNIFVIAGGSIATARNRAMHHNVGTQIPSPKSYVTKILPKLYVDSYDHPFSTVPSISFFIVLFDTSAKPLDQTADIYASEASKASLFYCYFNLRKATSVSTVISN